MDAVAGPVIDRVVGSTLTRITKELGYWFSSRKNVEAMNEEMKRLKEAAKEIELQMEENDVKDIPLPPHVSVWLKQVADINKEAERIPADGIGVGCFNIKKRYKAGKQSFMILENIKSCKVGDIPQFESTGEKVLARVVPSRYHASTSSGTVDDSTPNSSDTRDVIFKKALKCLEPNNRKTQMIALCGMGGVGKSHMMERLMKYVEKNMFDYVLKVIVEQNPGLNNLQNALAEQMGGTLTEATSYVRAMRLKNRFAGMSNDGKKKILVILDDLWEDVGLQDIGLTSPLPDGFKLLITSRKEDVCTKMGVDTDAIFYIGALNKDEAETLFFDTVGLLKNDDPYLYNIGEDIIRRCGNLPIALETIASTLKGHIKDETEWEEALSHLQHHNLKDHYGIVNQVFQISFDRLVKDDERAIFLLSGLFPDGFDIPLEELMRYAWGLKLLHLEGNTTLAQARRHVKACVNKLISANLLAESDRVQHVKLHDLARSFALDNISQVKQASIVNRDDISKKLTKDANDSYQRILLKCTGISEFPKDFNFPNLTFLKLMSGEKTLNFPDLFYKNMKELNVLSFEEMFHPPLLPRSSQISTHLRTLCLHGCGLIPDWSAFGYLLDLEVLSFADSRIKKLPSVVGKLKKLKLLELTGCSANMSIDGGVFRDLEQLEELYMRVYGWNAIRFTDTNRHELEVLSSKLSALAIEFFENNVQLKNMSLRQLKRFKISIGCLLEGDRDVYSFENTLKLVTNSSELLGCNINALFNETEKLHLQVKDMKHLKDITMPHSFSKLRVLEVVECMDLRYLFTVAMASSLRKLERLTISTCRVLKSLIHGDQGENGVAEVIKFKELKFLALNDLPELGSLCDVDICVELPQLLELRLGGLPNFTTIYSDNARQPFFNKQVVIPKLEKLKISSMKKLVQIWPSEITTSSSEEIHISMMRVMKVQDCDSLINLFPTNPMHLLHNLEKLQVKSCRVIEVLFNIELRSFGEIEDLSSLSSIHVVDSGNLSGILRVKGANDPRHLLNGFKAAEKIHIHGCRSFGDIITSDIITTSTTANYSDIRALVDIKMQDSEDSVFSRALKSLWPNNKTQTIALCGMGGVGKTHMMERLKKAVQDSKMFYWVLKVVVGRNTGIASLQHFVAEQMGGALTDTTIYARAKHLKNIFAAMSKEGEKKILVILDDVWEVLNLKDIGLPSPLPNGLKVLLTSRDAYVCSQMGVGKSSIFTVPSLSGEEAKALFYESARLDHHRDAGPELEEIAEHIVDRCHGNPLVIKSVAFSLRGEMKYVWKDTLNRLKHFLGNNEITDAVFLLSYEILSEKDKAVFLLSGLFPEDIDIPMEELMRYGWGLKLLPVVSTIAEARQIIETSADMLVNTRLLTRSDRVGCVQMHDLLRAVALRNDKQAFIDHINMSEYASDHESLERIYLDCTGMSEFPVQFDYPDLKLLKLMGEKKLLKFPQHFYDKMKNLEVVAFERIDDPLLPHFSFNLRTLCLDSCSLIDDDFSFLENLNKLEILIFARCGIRKLPSMVGKLRKLKLLDVTGCSDDLCIDDGVFEGLKRLEELYLKVDGSKAICFTDAN